MRIFTPSNSAFSPSGGGGSEVQVLASYTISQTITTDVSVPSFLIGTLPTSGVYLITVFLEISATTAATGTLAAQVNNSLGAVASVSQSMNAVVATHDAQFVTYASTDLAVEFEWSVTGFTTGSSDIKLTASAVRVF